jgi:hypothetical protein
MRTRRQTKLVREGLFLAEIEVELIEADEGWAPSLSLGEAEKLDTARQALRLGEIGKASQLGRVFLLTPVAV